MSRILLLTLRRSAAALAVALPVLGLLGAGLVPAAAEPNLTITLTSDADAVAPGDPITYSAEVMNRGEPVDARVVLTPPAYIAVGEADGEGVVDANAVTWTRNLPAAGVETFEVTASVGEIPTEELRATALISVYVGESTTPVVRTASADRIVGVDDEQMVEASSPLPMVLLIGGVSLIVVLVALGVVLGVAKRRRREAESQAAEEAGIRRRTPQPR